MELEFLDWLRNRLSDSSGIAQNWQNDAAVLTPPAGKQLVVNTDAIVDGTHFESAKHSLELIGRKALAVNLSDMAAMAAEPLAAFVSIVVPRNGIAERPVGAVIRGVYEGLIALAEKFGVTIAGGDTNVANAPLTIAITLIGTVDPGRAWRRDGAKPGDAIYVTGPLGGSIAGHHLTFEPKVGEALAIAKQCDVHAAMDVSDGLLLDLWRICEASGVGAELAAGAIPITNAAFMLASGDAELALQRALGDGEDFELLVVAPSESLIASNLIRVGRCVADRTMTMKRGATREVLLVKGYEHR